MRSRKNDSITNQEVHGYALHWLSDKLKLKDHGPKCTAAMMWHIVLIAASRITSIYAACRDLPNAPTDQALRAALEATLPNVQILERKLNQSLCTNLPKALLRKSRPVAIDLMLIPYHGEPLEDPSELYHSEAKSGTTKFHAYATAYVIHRGHRYTVALTKVSGGETMDKVVQRLLKKVRDRGIKIRFLLLDKGFFSVSVVQYLKRTKCPFLMPVIMRGRPNPTNPFKGLRSFLRKANGWYAYKMTSKDMRKTAHVKICVANKMYCYKKTGERKMKKLIYACWGMHGGPVEIRETYRKRFGIESSYRQLNQGRIRTCTRSPLIRLFYVGIALVLRNVWVWVHFTFFAEAKSKEEPEVHLEKLRFRRLLNWIQKWIEHILRSPPLCSVEI